MPRICSGVSVGFSSETLKELDPAIPTLGSILRDHGYRSSYIGKWHLSMAGTSLPEGVVEVVAGPGRECGRRLVEHPDVAKIAFTGSTEVGKLIVHAATGNLKKVSLELGGKSPVVIFPDAELTAAIPAASMACSGSAVTSHRRRTATHRRGHAPRSSSSVDPR